MQVCVCEGGIYLDFIFGRLSADKARRGEFCFDIFLCLGVF